MKNDISVVIPVYNSENTLAQLADRLEKVLSDCANNFEIILVNDGSEDKSWEKIKQLTKQYRCLQGVNLMHNYGQHNALLCGIRLTKYPVTITLDDDLQNPPEEIPKLLIKLNEGYDLVYGYPKEAKHGIYRNNFSVLTKFILSKAIDNKNLQWISSFRAFKTELRNDFENYRNTYISLDVLLIRGTKNIIKVLVNHANREVGKSNYNFNKLLRHSLNILFGYSSLPLRFVVIIGLVFSVLGFLIFVYTYIHYLIVGKVVPGFIFLTSTISIFSGVQLLTLGIIGEYIARIHLGLTAPAPYVISERVDIHNKNET